MKLINTDGNIMIVTSYNKGHVQFRVFNSDNDCMTFDSDPSIDHDYSSVHIGDKLEDLKKRTDNDLGGLSIYEWELKMACTFALEVINEDYKRLSRNKFEISTWEEAV